MPPAWTDPCNGHFTHEQVRGKCPIEIASANRVVNGGRRTATLGGVLPSSLQDAVSTADLAYLNTVDHTTDVGFDFEGATVQELLDGAKAGIINAGDAMAELAGRIPSAAATDQATIGHTISALENLVKVGRIVKNPSQISGNHLRVWAITTKKMKRLSGPILVVEGNSFSFEGDDSDGDRKSAKFSVDRMSSESLFDACIYQWSLLAHTLGIMPFEISAAFVFDTVHLLRVRHGEDFWTAQEYFIACLDLLDRQKVKADKIPSYDRGVMLSDARRFGEQFSSLASKTKSNTGNPGVKEWNGEFQPSGNTKVQPCPYFNSGKRHEARHLTSAGKCIFRHVCNHWVTDKGPGGRCESADHNWPKCDHPNKCDKRVE